MFVLWLGNDGLPNLLFFKRCVYLSFDEHACISVLPFCFTATSAVLLACIA